MSKIFIFLFAVCSIRLAAQLPANMYDDNAHAPFLWGVASGDPLPNSVILWTKINTPSNGLPQQLTWEVSGNSGFLPIISSGTVAVSSARDWTAHVDPGNLQPEKIYYYRFKNAAGNYSAVGRTRTAPSDTTNNTHVRFAIASCSSIYSGFFNAYRRISEKTDLDFVMHVGDYIYDFVDEDEEVRVPTPYPQEPTSMQEWRDRHTYYLLDPDLREARRMHPWLMVWDNHDITGLSDPLLLQSMKAYYEYNPIRIPNAADTSQIFRKFTYGKLVDVMMIDMLTRRDQDSLAPNIPAVLDNVQYNWLKTMLQNSTAKWKLVGNQKMFVDWSVIGLPSWFPGNGTVLTTNSWDGYDDQRDELLGFISSNNIDNVLFLSGDAHVTMVADCSDDPNNFLAYDGNTGSGSIAAEFLPTSISRGNFDEMGIPSFLLGLATGLSDGVNPHHVHSELTKNGYGLINVRPDTVIAELWYSDILNLTNQENFNEGYILKDAINHWERNTLSNPSSPKDTTGLVDTTTTIVSVKSFNAADKKVVVYPNPSEDGIFHFVADENYAYVLYDITSGKTIAEYGSRGATYDRKKFDLDLSKNAKGNYLVKYYTAKGELAGYKILVRQ